MKRVQIAALLVLWPAAVMAAPRETVYLYDDLNRLTNATYVGVHTIRTGFDEVGNLTRISVTEADQDNDGMPDAWETAHGLNPASGGDASLDPDGDGFNNLVEFQQGMNPSQYNRIVRVAAGAHGLGNGQTWADAYTRLQDALAAASAGHHIWVTAGSYRPDAGVGITAGDRTRSFFLKDGVVLRGGFAGTETWLDQRNLNQYKTILSGDIGIAGTSTDNSYHVVVGSSTTANAVLDGFVITGGNADGAGVLNSYGGGMLNVAGSPTVANCAFTGNAARLRGGGMYNEGGSSPRITGCAFTDNRSTYGGGMYNLAGSPVVTTSTFEYNRAYMGGGGMYNNNAGSPRLTGSTISGNQADFAGGGIYGNQSGAITLQDCVVSDNTATFGGGGIYASYSSSLVFINTQLTGSEATTGPQLWLSFGSHLTSTNSVIEGGAAAIYKDNSSWIE